MIGAWRFDMHQPIYMRSSTPPCGGFCSLARDQVINMTDNHCCWHVRKSNSVGDRTGVFLRTSSPLPMSICVTAAAAGRIANCLDDICSLGSICNLHSLAENNCARARQHSLLAGQTLLAVAPTSFRAPPGTPSKCGARSGRRVLQAPQLAWHLCRPWRNAGRPARRSRALARCGRAR